MYLDFYGLREKPFSQTPDPRFLYWNDAYREALASLSYGIRERKGFLTMIGEAGTGKTTLLRKLLDDLGSEVVSVLLFNPNATFEEILEYTLSELGITVPSGRKLAMLQRLNEFLLAAFAEGRNTILLIDEAQDLESDVLESLRLLSNLETSQEKILQIVLSGQPELATRLAEPGLRQLKQRIAVRCRLEPLQRAELSQYVAARVAVAGGSPDLFTPETLEPIWSFAEGIPRLINMVCDNALLVGYALGRRQIDRAVVDEVIADLRRLDVDFGGTSSSPGRASNEVAAPPASQLAPEPATPAASPITAPPPGAPPSPAPSADASAGADALVRPPLAIGTPDRVAAQTARAHASAGPRRWLGGALALLFLVGLGAVLALLAQGVWTLPERLSGRASDRPGVPDESTPLVAASEPQSPVEPDREKARRRSEVASPGEPAPEGPAAAEPGRRPASDRAEAGVEPAPREEAEPAVGPLTGEAGATAGAGRATGPAEQAAEAGAPSAAEGPASETEGALSPDLEAPADGSPEDRAESAVEPPPVVAPSAPIEPVAAAGSERRAPESRIQVQLGDTLTVLAARAYGRANLTTLDMLRERNPGISDIDLIVEGAEIEFPDPGPAARLFQRDGGVSVLALTTPALVEALSLQESLEARYRLPVDIEPTELGRRRDLYRVSIRAEDGRRQAMEIAGALGSILEDPGS